MPAGFRGNYADHVIELGIKRALRNKKQKEKKYAEQQGSMGTTTKLLKNSEAIPVSPSCP